MKTFARIQLAGAITALTTRTALLSLVCVLTASATTTCRPMTDCSTSCQLRLEKMIFFGTGCCGSSSSSSTSTCSSASFLRIPRGGFLHRQQASHQQHHGRRFHARPAGTGPKNQSGCHTVQQQRGKQTILRSPERSMAGNDDVEGSSTDRVHRLKLFAAAAIAVGFAYFAAAYRAVWLPLLDKERIQESTLNLLHRMQPEDPAHKWKALVMYAAGLSVWEYFGLSTIPVETSAGMVFGWSAALVSAAGKLAGATAAYCTARWFVADTVRNQLSKHSKEGSPVRVLLDASNSRVLSPWTTSLLMKFSCFPEMVKNFGAALLQPVRMHHFFLSTVFHGVGFTLLWTWTGVDTAAALEHTAKGSIRASGIALPFVTIMGLVVSPLSMAWWIRQLQKDAAGSSGRKRGSKKK